MTADLSAVFSDPDRDELYADVSPAPVRVLERPFTAEEQRPAWDHESDDEYGWAES